MYTKLWWQSYMRAEITGARCVRAAVLWWLWCGTRLLWLSETAEKCRVDKGSQMLSDCVKAMSSNKSVIWAGASFTKANWELLIHTIAHRRCVPFHTFVANYNISWVLMHGLLQKLSLFKMKCKTNSNLMQFCCTFAESFIFSDCIFTMRLQL